MYVNKNSWKWKTVSRKSIVRDLEVGRPWRVQKKSGNEDNEHPQEWGSVYLGQHIVWWKEKVWKCSTIWQRIWNEKRPEMLRWDTFSSLWNQRSVEGHTDGRESRNKLPAAMASEELVAVHRASWVEGSALGHTRQGLPIAWLGSNSSFAIHGTASALYSLDWASRQEFQQNKNEYENSPQLWWLLEHLPSTLFSGSFGTNTYK